MPRILYWLTGLFGTFLLIALLLLLRPTDAEDGVIMHLEQASRCDEILGSVSLNSQSISSILNRPPIFSKGCWQPVTLPENNPAQDVKVNINNPHLLRIWYRVRYAAPNNRDVTKPLMVYIPRVMAHAWQIRISGQPIADNRHEWRSTWNVPVAVPFYVEVGQLHHDLEIDIGIIATKAEGYSIASISVGDAAGIRNQKIFREYLQVTVPQAISIVMLLLGLFFFSFWLARRSESEYLLLAFASVVWSVCNLQYALLRPEHPNLGAWYSALIHYLPIPWLNWLIYLFTLRFTDRRIPWLESALGWYVIGITLVVLPFGAVQYEHNLLVVAVYTLVGIFSISTIIWMAYVSRSVELRAIAAALSTGIFAGANDLALTANVINAEGLFLVPYCGLAVFAACLYAIQRRYVASINGYEALNVSLAERLAEREAELNAYHLRLRELERTQTLADERQRLMHDMHDGLGSSLLTTLSAIEKNNLPQYAVAEALRSCIEDLRLIIDSLEPAANDLVTLLATIRYRLGQRLASADLELIWEINDLPLLPWLEPPDALNVLRLVQEAFVNVLKHANASRVRVTTRDLGDKVEIQIDDNGCGYDPKNITPGRGTHSQAKRTERLGGELRVDSKLGQGTSLRLLLPINKVPSTLNTSA